jgi:hypothetical protein
MSSYSSFLSPNSDGTSANITGTANFFELDLLQKCDSLIQSPFSLPNSSNQVSAAAASSSTRYHTM